jgi:hypothetical protein
VTAGTIFDRTRTPLTVWFTACWLFATQKDGISALSLQRALEIGSYQTAWAMLHRLRSVLVRPGMDQLSGVVEVDETFIGARKRDCAAAGPGARRWGGMQRYLADRLAGMAPAPAAAVISGEGRAARLGLRRITALRGLASRCQVGCGYLAGPNELRGACHQRP